MRNKLALLFVLGLFFTSSLIAQKVDTADVFSDKMNRSIKNTVILPDGYSENGDKAYPVLYLLHGHGGKYDSWMGIKKSLPEEATKWQMIIVCPDGQNSWYWDSPIDTNMQFETFVSAELVEYIDANYKTITSPKGRAVTGLSMGGHGGLWLAINHPDVFGACGSMSGGVDIRPFPNNWNMPQRLGKFKDNPEVWDAHTVITQLDKIEPNSLAIIIDCGTSDFFFQVNEKLHTEMLYRNIAHDYITRPGGHTSEYWENAVDYQMMFFSKFFNKK
jgi:Predicted esterase